MVDFKSRRHRLEIPAMPNTDDPAVLKKALDQMKRLVQDEFNRLATDFYDFKKATYDAGVIPLRAVADIAVTFDEYSMTATWELPDGQEITPTIVRVRILEISPNTWATYTYPKTSWSFSGLVPGTQYTFQVQLAATFEATDSFVSTTRNCPSVAVLRTAESDIRSKVFTTKAGVKPPSNTTFNDNRVIFNFPGVVPGAVNPPGAVGVAGRSWYEYKFQYRTACAWADAAGSTTVAGDIGDVTIDTGNVPFSTYPNTVFRMAWRVIDNFVALAWVYGEPFMAVNFANADCLGIVKSASLTTSPFSTASLFALPGVCQQDDTFLQITNELTDTEFLPSEPGFKCIEYIDSEWTLIADDTSNTAISPTIFTGLLSGTVAAIAAFNAETDFTLAFDIKVANNKLVLAGGTGAYTIIDIGDKIKVQMIQNTASYSLQVVVPRDGGGAYIFRADDLTYALWLQIYYVHDVSEPDGRVLYLNGVPVAFSTNAIANDFTGITGNVQINTVNDMNLRKLYAWNTAVVPAVVPVGKGLAAGGLNSSNAVQNTIYVFDLVTNTWSTATGTLTAAGQNVCVLSETGTYAWICGGTDSLNTERTDVVRWFWSTGVTSVGTSKPVANGPSYPMDNPGSAGYQYQNAVSTLDIWKMTYATEVWVDTGANAITNFPQATASNWGTAAYSWGRDGTDRYQKFTFSSETVGTLAGGFIGWTGFRPTGVSYQGNAMYGLGGNFTNAINKVSYATDTTAFTTLAAVLPNNGFKNISGHIGESPTRGIVAGGEWSSGDERAEAEQLAYATETCSAIAAMPSARENAGLGSGS